MTAIQANGIKIEYDTFGAPEGKPLLLVMGLGTQMIGWHSDFCQALADRGHFVIRYDNRDVGLSEKFGQLGAPDVIAMATAMSTGESLSAPYSLADMAQDGIGLLDALSIDKAHICGASMGGMIVQLMAIQAPERVLSLTSIMSTTGDPELPAASEEAMAVLLSPGATEREAAAERTLRVAGIIGSPDYPAPPEELRERALEAYDRCAYPEGSVRHIAAIATQENRAEALQAVQVPALVIHGKADPLVRLEAGIATHEALPDSELMLIDGMGHDMPEALWKQVIDGIDRLTSRKEGGPSS